MTWPHGLRRGFGSLRVRVVVGGSTWTTSIFPDSARGRYVLPIKRAVRTAESLDAGDVATVKVELIDFDLPDAPAGVAFRGVEQGGVEAHAGEVAGDLETDDAVQPGPEGERAT